MTCTVLLLDLPATTLIGIDLLTFTASPRFQGIAFLPSGWHFLFSSPTSSISIRHGTWFCFKSNSTPSVALPSNKETAPSNEASSDLLVFKWSSEKEELVPVIIHAELRRWKALLASNDEKGRLLRQGLFPYRQTGSLPSPPRVSYARKSFNKSEGDNDDAGDFVEDSVDWPLLTAQLSHELLQRFTNPSPSQLVSTAGSTAIIQSPTLTSPVSFFYTLTTSSTGPQDRDDIPGLSSQEARDGLFGDEEKDLGFLDIDLKKTWREGAVGRERTEGARDRSWALQDVVSRNHSTSSNTKQQMQTEKADTATSHPPADNGERNSWGGLLLGELQLTFIMVLTLSNYSCLEEWKRITTLVLTSYNILSLQPDFYVNFLGLLLLQLRHCDDVEGGLFDVSPEGGGGEGNLLRGLLRGFKGRLDDAEAVDGSERWWQDVKEKMQDIEEWVSREWGWELSDSWVRRGMVELEDGERVELEIADMDAENERGEYAPVVVELKAPPI
ncbi:hypothetical protein MMC13_001237 [Lambiella insularis]|nr:hypothetical protein [Lambiella insularis]